MMAAGNGSLKFSFIFYSNSKLFLNEDTASSDLIKNCSASQIVSDNIASLSQINSNLNNLQDLVKMSFKRQRVSYSLTLGLPT